VVKRYAAVAVKASHLQHLIFLLLQFFVTPAFKSNRNNERTCKLLNLKLFIAAGAALLVDDVRMADFILGDSKEDAWSYRGTNADAVSLWWSTFIAMLEGF